MYNGQNSVWPVATEMIVLLLPRMIGINMAPCVNILTHRYTRICGSEGMFERSGHQLGHTGLRTPVLIPKLPDLLRSGILMDRTVLSPKSYCNAGSSGTDPITLH